MSSAKIHVEVMENPGSGRPWAVSIVAADRFVWRLFDSRKNAMDAASQIAAAEIMSGTDFAITIARLPTPIPSTCAALAGIERADVLLASLAKAGR